MLLLYYFAQIQLFHCPSKIFSYILFILCQFQNQLVKFPKNYALILVGVGITCIRISFLKLSSLQYCLTVLEQSISFHLFRLLQSFRSFIVDCIKILHISFCFIPTLEFMLLFSIRFLNWLFWRYKRAIDFYADLVCGPLAKISYYFSVDFIGEQPYCS